MSRQYKETTCPACINRPGIIYCLEKESCICFKNRSAIGVKL